MKGKILSEEYYNKKKKAYKIFAIFYAILATIMIIIGRLELGFLCIVLSLTHGTRLDSLHEHYALYQLNKDETKADL